MLSKHAYQNCQLNPKKTQARVLPQFLLKEGRLPLLAPFSMVIKMQQGRGSDYCLFVPQRCNSACIINPSALCNQQREAQVAGVDSVAQPWIKR